MHSDDINTIDSFQGDDNMILTGGDDGFVFATDIRAIDHPPVATFIGHNEGITHLSTRIYDPNYFITNSKDQSIKMWDIRVSNEYHDIANPKTYPISGFDYRIHYYPKVQYKKRSPLDRSVLTMRGHSVLRTLIKCYFSPEFITGQKYVYTGSADGGYCVYDTLTGDLVSRRRNLDGSIMRDIIWHPTLPILITPSFSGEICLWEWRNIRNKDKIQNANADIEDL